MAARPGMRTTTLVSLAACVAMIQANLLLNQEGKAGDSFVVLDLMRLPLGILSGMGFIGAGAILRRDHLIVGVTTAATLWFVTVLGLCFGGGQIALGWAGLALGVLVLSGLRRFEGRMKQDFLGTLTVMISAGGPTDQEIRDRLMAARYTPRSCAVTAEAESEELTYQVTWRAKPSSGLVPEFVHALTARQGVSRVSWSPQNSPLTH